MRKVAALLLAVLGGVGASPTPAPTSPPMASITIVAPKATLHLQVARTESEREMGLMYRAALPVHTGMLFVFPHDAPIEFWMKNTLIPLDMIFIAADGRVRSIAANVPATKRNTPDAAIPRRDGEAEYVIELPANEAASDGITPGLPLPIKVPPEPLQ